MPSFSSGDPYSTLVTLPIEGQDFSLVATLSLIRTFDYIAVAPHSFRFCHLAPNAFHRGISDDDSGTLINIVFALALALWFSGIFYKNVSRGGRSTKASIWRSLFLITWGVATLSIGFIFNFISYLLPYLTSAILGIFTRPTGLFLLVLHPFSIGFAIANVVYPSLYSSIPVPPRTALLVPRFVPPALAYLSSIGYAGLALVLGRRTINSVSKITRGVGAKISRPVAKDFLLRLRSPLPAYIVKDLRLASMNPSLAFLYAAPLFEVITLAVITVQFPVMRATAMIVSVRLLDASSQP